MRTVTEPFLMYAGVAHVAVYVLDKHAGELRLIETSGDSPGGVYGLSSSYPLSGCSPVAEAVRADRSLWLTPAQATTHGDIHGDSSPGPAVPDMALGALPLGADGRQLGCLVIVDRASGGFDTDRRAFLELYADHVAARLEAAAGPGGDTMGRTEPGPVLDPGLDGIHVGSFTLTLETGRIDADTQVLELMGIAPDGFDGRVETLLARTVPEDLPALMSVIDPGHMTSVGRDLEFRVRRPAGELRWLRLRSRVLIDAADEPQRVLGMVAEASCLRPGTDEVSRLQQLSTALATAMTVRDVSRAVLAALRGPLGADRMAFAELQAGRPAITALDPPEAGMWPEGWRRVWSSGGPEAAARDLPTLESALRRDCVSLWATSTDLEPALAEVGRGGLAVLPLPADGQMVGACLIGWDEPHEFGPEERSLLTAVAGLVGQALVRARALDAEHELAAMLQRSLLPRTLPRLPGCVAVARYLPATAGLEVGGDWYDVIPLSDRFVALVIGDVQGHSPEAATIMGQIRTAIRAYAIEGHPPDVVVSHTNRLLLGMDTDAFATCCYVALDTEEGDVWCVRAGHLPPLLRAPDGSTQEVLDEGGPPLGVLADAEFPMTTVGLTPGTMLVLLTDGLVESSSLRLEDGTRRVCEVLSATDPCDADRMADELIGRAERRDDDVALLLLRYDGMTVRPLRAGWAVWRLPDAVMHARRFTARTLRSWKVTQEMDAALLVVSELVTNAMVHTRGEVRLDLTLTGDRLRVAVSDSSPRAPARQASVDWESTGGRGLLLVEAVSQSWGSVPLSGGKQVWGEIALGPSTNR
jgi:GAF domain-containing protein/anti-sigma regulatory factor (Ser/Thr protein kinase)